MATEISRPVSNNLELALGPRQIFPTSTPDHINTHALKVNHQPSSQRSCRPIPVLALVPVLALALVPVLAPSSRSRSGSTEVSRARLPYTRGLVVVEITYGDLFGFNATPPQSGHRPHAISR
ncbi:hypothetical protein B0H66DRAFT_538257 [Apodospora peruviana]|uniref:Uncharacterized protein n=1 Tax=Apodospora peruviana TaxID=516989 RepID=A0AAE0HUK6_9PEZI|nr:hypothetical protein B0H66DRAFT_538257 [Apodospora peruviana]